MPSTAANIEFDSIAEGEADHYWAQILSDFENNKLQPYYKTEEPPDLKGLPYPRYDLLDFNKYLKPPIDRNHPITVIETSRGCPRNCSYCLVTKFFGKKMRYKPISDVIDEIKHHGAKDLPTGRTGHGKPCPIYYPGIFLLGTDDLRGRRIKSRLRIKRL